MQDLVCMTNMLSPIPDAAASSLARSQQQYHMQLTAVLVPLTAVLCAADSSIMCRQQQCQMQVTAVLPAAESSIMSTLQQYQVQLTAVSRAADSRVYNQQQYQVVI